jgi:hypothetical protein
MTRSWWTLVMCCDLYGVNRQLLRSYLDAAEAERVRAELYGAESRFVAAWRDQPSLVKAIRDSVGRLDPFGYSDYVSAATRELWEADMALCQAFRDILVFADSVGVDLLVEGIADNETGG